MIRLYHASIALLLAIAIASTSSSTKSFGPENHPSDDPNKADPARSTDGVNTQKVASWEVQPDGSATTKEQKTSTLSSAKAQIRRDKNGKWIVVPYEEASSTDHASSRPQPQEEPVETLEAMEDIEFDDEETDSSFGVFLTPSRSFMALEARIAKEGHTAELMKELARISNTYEDPEDQRKGNDWAFAVTHMSFKQLFKPNVKTNDDQVFIDAIFNLKIAADHGAQTAQAVLGMLDLIGIPDPDELEDPNLPPLSREERRTKGYESLESLAFYNNSIALLAMAYGTLSGKIPVPATDLETPSDPDALCEAALPFYRKCADRTVRAIIAEGNERFLEVVRLSNKPRKRGFWGTIGMSSSSYESRILAAIEHNVLIANDPLDAQYSQAMQYLGDLFFNGDPAAHIAPDQRLAAQYYRRAAEAGDSAAQANYGLMLAKGMGVERDFTQALMYLERAAQINNSRALYGLGELYFRGHGVPQNVTLALTYINEALLRGNAQAHSFLGSVYLFGQEGVPIDYNKAFENFQAAVKATDGKFSQPLFNLAIMHYHGYGTPRSCITALSLFRAVAMHHDVNSAFPFSLDKAFECYKKGDYIRAYLHYRLVAELGDKDAQCNAAYLLEHHGDSILKWRWLALAARGSNNPPLYEALALYSQAAALNDSEAIRKTGICYHEPWDGVCPSNHTKAFERYQVAAELGDAQANHNCGLMLLTGDGISQNMTAARSYYVRCSKASFPSNVPCALVLMGLTIFQSVKALTGWI